MAGERPSGYIEPSVPGTRTIHPYEEGLPRGRCLETGGKGRSNLPAAQARRRDPYDFSLGLAAGTARQ